MTKILKYFFQFVILIILFLIFKVLGLKIASNFSKRIGILLGPLFRSKKLIQQNILKAFPSLDDDEIKKISKGMWGNYGRILSEYVFLEYFRKSNLKNNVEIEGHEILEKIKKEKKPVIFISGHFNNFELMAMYIENSGINLAAIYRPLNNKFLNPLMEKLRIKYICQNQIKKGISGMKKMLYLFREGTSIALMIDQRVSQGIKSKFFHHDAYTTTIPAQFVKKFNCPVVPIYIERIEGVNFKLKINNPIDFKKKDTIESITADLNKIIENMILKNPDQWIWSHNRWK